MSEKKIGVGVLDKLTPEKISRAMPKFNAARLSDTELNLIIDNQDRLPKYMIDDARSMLRLRRIYDDGPLAKNPDLWEKEIEPIDGERLEEVLGRKPISDNQEVRT